MMQEISHLASVLHAGLQEGLSAAVASACDAVTMQLAKSSENMSALSLEDAGKDMELLIKCSLTSKLVQQLELLNASPNREATADGSQQQVAAAVSVLHLHSGIVRYAAAVVIRSDGLQEGVCQECSRKSFYAQVYHMNAPGIPSKPRCSHPAGKDSTNVSRVCAWRTKSRFLS